MTFFYILHIFLINKIHLFFLSLNHFFFRIIISLNYFMVNLKNAKFKNSDVIFNNNNDQLIKILKFLNFLKILITDQYLKTNK